MTQDEFIFEEAYRTISVYARNGNFQAVEDYIKRLENIDVTNRFGQNLLYNFTVLSRCDDDYEKVAILLINNGADVNFREGETNSVPLHRAASHGNKNLVKLLIEKGANLYAKNYCGEMPIDVCYKNKEIKDILQSYMEGK